MCSSMLIKWFFRYHEKAKKFQYWTKKNFLIRNVYYGRKNPLFLYIDESVPFFVEWKRFSIESRPATLHWIWRGFIQ